MLDDARVCIRDDKNGQSDRYGKTEGKIGVFAKFAECFVGSVGAGGKPVGTQTNPCQERNEGDMMKDLRIIKILRLSQKNTLKERRRGLP